jgi:hypothetical protein
MLEKKNFRAKKARFAKMLFKLQNPVSAFKK